MIREGPLSHPSSYSTRAIDADVGVDDLGIGTHRLGDSVRFAYPIAVVAGMKVT